MSLEGAPVPDGGWKIYDSYVEDPKYARYFTISWTGAVAVYFICKTLPGWWIKGRRGEVKADLDMLLGVREDWKRGYLSLPSKPFKISKNVPRTLSFLTFFTKYLEYTPTTFLQFKLGQYLLLALIPPLLLLMVLQGAQLHQSPNRLGFVSLALLPPIFILVLHSSPLHLLVPLPYSALNFLHRWLGRFMLILVAAHGGAWLSHPTYSISNPDVGPKLRKGLLALAFLAFLTLTSILPIRRWNYALSMFFHTIGFVGLIVAIARHTLYSYSWIGWGVVLPFGVDAVMKLLRVRIVEFEVSQVSETTLELKGFGVNAGWNPGQFVVLRLFFSPQNVRWFDVRSWTVPFQSHPFTIVSSPPSSLDLLIKIGTSGSWTASIPRSGRLVGLVEGPYGGIPPNARDKEKALIIVGGSGISFGLAAQKMLQTRCKLVWVRRAESTIVELEMRRNNMEVWDCTERGRPDLKKLVKDWLEDIVNPCAITRGGCKTCNCEGECGMGDGDCQGDNKGVIQVRDAKTSSSDEGQDDEEIFEKKKETQEGLTSKKGKYSFDDSYVKMIVDPVPVGRGGVAILVCGPQSMVKDVRNAVTEVNWREWRRVGGVVVHAESFSV